MENCTLKSLKKKMVEKTVNRDGVRKKVLNQHKKIKQKLITIGHRKMITLLNGLFYIYVYICVHGGVSYAFYHFSIRIRCKGKPNMK